MATNWKIELPYICAEFTKMCERELGRASNSEHRVSLEQGGPWPKGRGAMKSYRNKPGAAGTVAPGMC